MNTDTSKFSLRQANVVIQTRLEALVFKPFSYYVKDGDLVVDNILRRLRYYDDAITVPYGFSGDNRVFVVTVCNDVKKGEAEKVLRIKIDRLILCRSKGENPTGRWYFQESLFRLCPSGDDRFFDCWKSSVRLIPSNDEEFHEMVRPPDDFSITFWKAISGWAVEIFSKRELMNHSVKLLNGDAVEKVLIARRFLQSTI